MTSLVSKKYPKAYKGDLNCSDMNLTSLKGAPREVDGYFRCARNNLTSLEDAPEKMKVRFSCIKNRLTSLEGVNNIIKEIDGGSFLAHSNPIKSHVLGLLYIKGLKDVEIDNHAVQLILNKHLPNVTGNKGALACQNELLDAGFDEYAQV
jgi:hypothetical protein